MDTATKIALVNSFAEEIITEEELKTLFETNNHPVAYDGFEPSGNPHIAQGILRARTIRKLLKAGVKFKMLVADWHAWANNKYGGDLETIQKCGKYLIHIWKAAGLDTDKVEFIWANDLVNDRDYWKTVMQIARNSTVQRIIRCGQIMGRKEGEMLQTSQLFYPCMQAADIFHLNIDIAQLGMDQRKVNILARELGPKLFNRKPIAVHHHMLMGLLPPTTEKKEERWMELKMSKSIPASAIFMTDTPAEIMAKITKAYCPEGVVEENPILEYCKYIVLEELPELVVERPAKFGGNVTFTTYHDLAQAFQQRTLHPSDLKRAVSEALATILKPVHAYFAKNKEARTLYEELQQAKITR